MGNLPINGNLPIEAKGIPNIGWSNSQYRLQDLPVVGIATVFTLACIVLYIYIFTVYVIETYAQNSVLILSTPWWMVMNGKTMHTFFKDANV